MSPYLRALASTTLGKRTPSARYVHREATAALPAPLRAALDTALRRASLEAEAWDVAKFAPEHVSLLAYPDFFRAAFPGLVRAWTVPRGPGPVVVRTWAEGPGRPILHRKELLLQPEDPRAKAPARLTAWLEGRGLLAHPTTIGTAGGWARRLRQGGLSWALGRPLCP